LEVHSLEFYGRDGVLKMLKGFMVMLKGFMCNNFYYLKGNTVTGQMTISVGSR